MRISDWSSDVCSSDLWRNSRQRGGFWTYSEPFKVEFAGSRNPRVRRMLLRFVRRNRGLFRDPCGTRYLSKSSCDRSAGRSEEHTSELQSLMRSSYAVFCLKKKRPYPIDTSIINHTVTYATPSEQWGQHTI